MARKTYWEKNPGAEDFLVSICSTPRKLVEITRVLGNKYNTVAEPTVKKKIAALGLTILNARTRKPYVPQATDPDANKKPSSSNSRDMRMQDWKPLGFGHEPDLMEMTLLDRRIYSSETHADVGYQVFLDRLRYEVQPLRASLLTELSSPLSKSLLSLEKLICDEINAEKVDPVTFLSQFQKIYGGELMSVLNDQNYELPNVKPTNLTKAYNQLLKYGTMEDYL